MLSRPPIYSCDSHSGPCLCVRRTHRELYLTNGSIIGSLLENNLTVNTLLYGHRRERARPTIFTIMNTMLHLTIHQKNRVPVECALGVTIYYQNNFCFMIFVIFSIIQIRSRNINILFYFLRWNIFLMMIDKFCRLYNFFNNKTVTN